MELVHVAPGRSLEAAAADSYLRARAAGCPAGITSAHRSSAEQAKLRAKWEADPVNNAFAKLPGRSLHEAGLALDLPPEPELWMRAHPEYGWRFTDPKERWHAEYKRHLDTAPRDLTPPTPLEEEDEMKLTLARLKGSPHVYIGNGIHRRHVKTERELGNLQTMMRAGVLKGDPEVAVIDDIAWLGEDVTS